MSANAKHRVDRVLGFFSSRPNWDSPTPSPPDECAAPPGFRGSDTVQSLAGESVGGSQFGRGDSHCGTLGIYVLCDAKYSCKSFHVSVLFILILFSSLEVFGKINILGS
jgi:hypothetical protein